MDKPVAKPFRTRFAVALLMASAAFAPAHAGGLTLLPSAPAAGALPLAQPFPPGAPAPVAGAARQLLVPFAEAADRMRLTGEDDSLALTFSLDGEQRAAGGLLQIGYQNAVSVLPDSAVMDVEVNGEAAGSFAIRSPNGYALERFPLAAAQLRQGRNEVRLRARQHHRVDCSLEAAYELWTRLDPAASGFMAHGAGGFTALPDLLAVGRSAGGVTDIRLVAPDPEAAALVNESLPLLQALALYLNRPDLRIGVSAAPGEGPGIDLYAGSPAGYRNLPQAAAVIESAPPGLSVRDGASAGRAAVVLRGESRADLNAKLVEAVRATMRDGLDSGVLAGQWGRIVAEPSKRYTLRDAGYRTQPFAGRLARVHFELEMPADFYPAEYDTVDLNLKGATAPGLRPGAQLLVRVNGKSARSYPFRDVRGEEFDGKRLELPLRAFHPGVNRVEILAELPVAADTACAPEARDEEKPRFILLEETEIEIPALARIGRLPDLAALSGAAYPFGAGKPFDVFVDSTDTRVLGGALTVLARLAQSARKPLASEIRFSAPGGEGGRDALVFSVRHDVAAVMPAKGGRIAADTPVLAAIDPVMTASVGGTGFDPADSQRLLEAFHSSTAREDAGLPLTARAANWARHATERFGQWLKYEDARASRGGGRESGTLVTLEQIRAPFGSGTWTVLSADSPADLEKGAARLTQPAVWASLEGGRASVETASLELVTEAPSRRYVTDLSDTGFFNLRRLAAAWFSDNFQFYIVSVIALMAAFALWLGHAVRRSGVRTDK